MTTKLAIKTAIAAVLAWFIPHSLNWNYSIYAVIASIIVMGLTSGSTLKLSMQRIAGTIIGGLTGIICSLLLGTNAWSLGIGVFLGVFISSWFKFKEAAKLSGYVAALIVLTHGQQPWLYGWGRFLETLFGVGVALTVNRCLWRSQASQELRRCLSQILANLGYLYQEICECYFTEQCDDKKVNKLKAKMIVLMPESRELWKDVKQGQLHESPELSINNEWEFLVRRIWEHILMMDHSSLAKRKYNDTFWLKLKPELEQLRAETQTAFVQLSDSLVIPDRPQDLTGLDTALTTATRQLDKLQHTDHTDYEISELLRFFNFFYTLEEVGRKLRRMAEDP
jgi:hypothetical protein